jgi:hypothetical protein
MKFTPSPEQAAALFDANLIFVEDLPGIAAGWLAEGRDSESIRLLAGAEHDDPDEIRTWWRQGLDDLDVSPGSTEERWQRVWSYETSAWRAGSRTSQEVLRDVVAYVQQDDYPTTANTPEAVPLYMLWDEMTSFYEPGRTPAEIWADVDAYLSSFG